MQNSDPLERAKGSVGLPSASLAHDPPKGEVGRGQQPPVTHKASLVEGVSSQKRSTHMAVLQIPVVKSKGGVIPIETDEIPEDVFGEACFLGLKELVNRGTSKLTKASVNGDEEKLKVEAMKIAQAQFELIMSGKIRFAKAKPKISGAVKTEAMRLARGYVKDAIKAEGGKIKSYTAAGITALATQVLEQMPELLVKAEANIAERKMPAGVKIDLKSVIDPAHIAKLERDKAETLSAKQAGKPKARAVPQKPSVQPQARA